MRLLVALLLVIPALAALGQDGRSDLAVHTVYVEVLGNAMPGTLNIDVLVADRFALRFGGILLPLVDEEGDLIGDEHYTPQDLSFAAGTVMVSRLFGQGAVRLEVGAGVMGRANTRSRAPGDTDLFDSTVGLTGVLGFRVQPEPGGFGIRLGFTPLMDLRGLHPSAGLSVVYGLE
ncbi:MAG: hypothetical protein AAF089_14205 [Bacteroidota bacterium]